MNSIAAAHPSIRSEPIHLDNAAIHVVFYTPGFRAPDPVRSDGGTGVDVKFYSSPPAVDVPSSHVNLPASLVELITGKLSAADVYAVTRAEASVTKSSIDIPA